jgi:hypothetical protein
MGWRHAGVHVVIGTEELRDGADAAAGVADGAGPLVDRLGGLAIAAGSFGLDDPRQHQLPKHLIPPVAWSNQSRP